MAIRSTHMLPARAVCERYKISSRTLTRWSERGDFPAPIRINARRYFDSSELDRWDARMKAARDEEHM